MDAERGMGLWSAVAIGIGGMVGGGIFAVLGLSVQLSGGGAPIAFLVAGIIALLTAFSYVRLSVAYPSQGGTVEFLNQAFGRGLFSGSLNILLWLSYIVMLSLYAHAFGSYAASLVGVAGNPWLEHLFISLVIVLFTVLNVAGATAVGRSEVWIVALKVAILVAFVVAGLFYVDARRLALDTWSPPLTLLAGGMLIFLAYEGFELIANTARDVRNPRRNLPRAYFLAVGIVIVLYVAVAAVTVGNLSLAQIAGARDYALAEAARPFMGQGGFALIGVAALLSTASAINATLYGAARVSYIIAKEGELPAFLEHKIWRKPIEGLLLTALATLLVANLFDLGSIALMGSAGFLLIFAAVNGANLVLGRRSGRRGWLAGAGLAACVVALAILLIQAASSDVVQLLALPLMVILSVGVEATYRKFRAAERRVA
jgi:amino acid transporter